MDEVKAKTQDAILAGLAGCFHLDSDLTNTETITAYARGLEPVERPTLLAGLRKALTTFPTEEGFSAAFVEWGAHQFAASLRKDVAEFVDWAVTVEGAHVIAGPGRRVSFRVVQLDLGMDAPARRRRR